MIVAYFTEKEKYLQKGDYRKDFDVNSIAELISNIKISEPVLIKASKKDIFDFKFKSKIEGEFEYEIVSDTVKFNEQTVSLDLKELNSGVKDYIKYSVRPEFQDRIGKVVFITKNKDIKDYILSKTSNLAIEISELSEFHKNVLNNNTNYLIKLIFNGKDVNVLATQEGK